MTTEQQRADMVELLGLGLAVRQIEETSRTAFFVASTDAVDTYDEIVDQGSWELDIYRSNPVVLFAHKSRELPIGKCVDVGVRGGRLECAIEFAPEAANPEAEKVWQLVRGRFLQAVSVGFIPRDGKWEMRNGREVFVLYGNSLREISVTPVPANHEALAKMRARALAEREAKQKTEAAPVDVPQETPMDEKTKAALESKDAELAELRAKCEALEAEVASAQAEKASLQATGKGVYDDLMALREVLGAPVGGLLSPLDTAKQLVIQRDALLATLTERDVDALVGVKLLPAQRDAFVALAKSDRAKFDAIVEGLPSLNLMGRIVESGGEKDAAIGPDLADMLGDGTEAPRLQAADLSDLL